MDKRQFEQLYEEYVDAVARFLSYYTKERDQLEDWLQEVFFRLWKYRENIDPDNPHLKTYLLKSAKNVALTALRQQKNNIIELKPDFSDSVTQSNKESSQQAEEFNKKYKMALKKVPPKAKKVYQLSKERGFSYKEIAGFLHISPKTVEAHISKTLSVLRKELKEYST